VGFYGGINYGHGYAGTGYKGGRWDRGTFRYNRAVSNVDARHVRHVYGAPMARPVRPVNRVSFSGGKAVARVLPTARERQFESAGHAGPRPEQVAHENAARGMPTQRVAVPRRVPQVVATPKPSEFGAHQQPRSAQRGRKEKDEDQRQHQGPGGKGR
jgi:hypothetical protein